MLLPRRVRPCTTEITRNQAELLDGGFEIIDDFLGDDVRVGKIGGVF
jgi:hypothetical protein